MYRILLQSPLGKKKDLVNDLFTCNHILTKEILLSSKDIILEIENNKTIIIPKKHRIIFINSELDYTFIEILDENNLEDFYSIDDGNLKCNFSPDTYINKLVIIFAIMKNKRTGLSNWLIKSIKEKLFIYTCNIYPGSSGGVIVKSKYKLCCRNA